MWQGGEEDRSKDTIILCLFFSQEEILAPEYSTVGRHLESGLAKGSVVIRSHKSDMKGRDHMVGEESDGAVLSAVTVQMCSLTQQSKGPHPILCYSPTEPSSMSDDMPCSFLNTSEPARCQ